MLFYFFYFLVKDHKKEIGLGALGLGLAGLAAYGIKKGVDYFRNRKSKKNNSRKRMSQPEKTEVVIPNSPVAPNSPNVPSPIVPSPIVPQMGESTYSQPQPITSPEIVDPVIPFSDAREAKMPENKPNLVPVKGNSSVYRCLNCKTFVSANRPHTEAECAARRNKSDSKTKSTSSTKRRRKVDKELFKNFRKLEKENASISAATGVITKKAVALLKKYKKQKKTQIPKQLTSFLEYVTKKF